MGDISSILSYFSGATKGNQDLMLTKQDITNKKIDTLQESMQRLDITNKDKLFLKYPEGYFIFAIDDTGLITPNKSQLRSEYDIDWTSARIMEIDEKNIKMALPNIKSKKYGSVLRTTTFTIGRTIGGIRIGPRLGDLQIMAEVLFDNTREIICVLGFKESK
jgi:hypothetical protein